MKCELDYCIYNDQFQCILNNIEINGTGQCESCILVSLPVEALEKYKKLVSRILKAGHGKTIEIKQ